MCCSVTCPGCRKSMVPEIVFENEPETGILDGSAQSEATLMATCTDCNQAFMAKAIATRRGEVLYFTEVEGSPLLRTPCPRCRCVVGAHAKPVMILPPTGGDYEWIETDAEIICPVCDYAWEDRIKVELDTRKPSVIPHPIEGPRWQTAFVVAKTSYSRGELYGVEEVRAFADRTQFLAWCEHNPKLFQRLHRPGAYEYVRLERRGTQYFTMDGTQIY